MTNTEDGLSVTQRWHGSLLRNSNNVRWSQIFGIEILRQRTEVNHLVGSSRTPDNLLHIALCDTYSLLMSRLTILELLGMLVE